MNILLILSLLLNGGTMSRPVEDDPYTLGVLAIAGHIEGPGSTLIFESYRSGTYIGAMGDADDCGTGVWWSRKDNTVSPLRSFCP